MSDYVKKLREKIGAEKILIFKKNKKAQTGGLRQVCAFTFFRWVFKSGVLKPFQNYKIIFTGAI